MIGGHYKVIDRDSGGTGRGTSGHMRQPLLLLLNSITSSRSKKAAYGEGKGGTTTEQGEAPRETTIFMNGDEKLVFWGGNQRV